MARIRSIKPDAFTSESLSTLDYFTRWTFAGVWTYLDDYGYGRADARLIKAALFPLDDDVTPGKVTKALDGLICAGSMCRFTVEARDYIHAPRWADHQKVNRPTRSKFPQCPEHDGGTTGEVSPATHCGLTEGSVKAHGGLTGGREQGTGNREQGSVSAAADGAFTEFWSAYPRKVAKPAARKAFLKAISRTDPAQIMAGLTRHQPVWAKGDAKFIPHPATWLNDERWGDTLEVPRLRDMRPEGW